MCNQNQGKEKKSFRSPLLPVRPVQKSQKNLRKYLLQISIINTLFQTYIFVQKLSPRKSLKNCRKLRSFYIWRENSNI